MDRIADRELFIFVGADRIAETKIFKYFGADRIPYRRIFKFIGADRIRSDIGQYPVYPISAASLVSNP